MPDKLMNNKGLTLTEIMVSLLIIGIVSVPITMMIHNSITVNKKSYEQQEINSVMRIVRQNVKDAIKGGIVFGNTTPPPGRELIASIDPVTGIRTYQNQLGLVVRDHDSTNTYDPYRFDAQFLGYVLNTNDRVVRYLVTLYKKNNLGNFVPVRSFKVEANTL